MRVDKKLNFLNNNLEYYANKCYDHIISFVHNFIYSCNHHMLSTFFSNLFIIIIIDIFFNLFIMGSLLYTTKIFNLFSMQQKFLSFLYTIKIFNLYDFFQIYHKMFNIFMMICVATSKRQKKHVENGYYGKGGGLFFYDAQQKVCQVGPFISSDGVIYVGWDCNFQT